MDEIKCNQTKEAKSKVSSKDLQPLNWLFFPSKKKKRLFFRQVFNSIAYTSIWYDINFLNGNDKTFRLTPMKSFS